VIAAARALMRTTAATLSAGQTRGALAVLALYVALAALGGSEPQAVDVTALDLPPALAHPMGTDHLGRDVLRRLLAAPASGAPAVAVGAMTGLAAAAPLAIGLALGGNAAALARLVASALTGTPALVLAVLAGSALRADLTVVAAVWAAASAPATADSLAAPLVTARHVGLTEGLRRHGLSAARVWIGHGLIALGHRAALRATLQLTAGLLVAEATLSYLGGFGVQEPAASWGNMMAAAWGRPDGNPLAWLAPLACLTATLAALHRVAEALHDPP
jgi:peptide/nickel transport system permease protein